MKINYLEMNNFRQFVGKQTIRFSTDSEKKVTIIIAESGVGKTTLIQCFQWVFYGECKYKNPINNQIKNEMQPFTNTQVSCSIEIVHSNQVYLITRNQTFYKTKSIVQTEPSILVIDIKTSAGISNQVKGSEATRIIKELMHKDLFPYFFLEGESLSKVGEQMSKGKSGDNNEFLKAIKGLLGFNYLYEAQKDLTAVSSNYMAEIKSKTFDQKLKKILIDIGNCEETIQKNDERISIIEKEMQYFENERTKINERIIKNVEVEQKQTRVKALESELSTIKPKIDEQKRYLFKKFSSQGIYELMSILIEKVDQVLVNSDCIDKGIPGMDVNAVMYLLEKQVCICGHDLIKGSKEREQVTKLLNLLPPNYIGFEIEKFKENLDMVKKNSQVYNQDFIKARSDLNDLMNDYNRKVAEKNRLNDEIGSVNEDISLLKQQEIDYYNKIIVLSSDKTKIISEKNGALNIKASLEEEKTIYQTQDETVRRLKKYQEECDYLKNRISKFCNLKEQEKRISLEKAINDIFKDFYNEQIAFTLDSNYDVKIEAINNELAEDFTSGGQDVAIALAFIGGVIKLNREKDNNLEDIIDEDVSEEYPLVMDAPTSNFGMKQMKSFSEVMPKITDQIIVFINDKDGPILKKQMNDNIGSEWLLVKHDSYHSTAIEVTKHGE